MAPSLFLSHFTPSMMDPKVLEAIFVQREATLQRTVEQVVESVLTRSKHHNLFIGPRGIGKTHFLSLLHHRLDSRDDLREASLIAWLREEEWGVTSFLELLIRILKALDAAYPKLGLGQPIAALYDHAPETARSLAESLLLETLKGRTLVLLVENLDDLFNQLKDTGQRDWRAFLQNHAACTIVATAPALFSGVSRQKSPFYGFFRTELLKPFGFEDVVNLLEKIARERGDKGLARAIRSPHGRARLRAMHHLAEGNPRIYIIFAQFLTEQTLETLVEAFLHTLDELTPYYQARMRDLSGQQRKIVEFLCDYRGAAPVKEIARICFITQQTCSSQLKELRDKGYAKSRELGRESYYELAEPLMRICLDVKKQRGEPIGLFVQFLRLWYSQPELNTWLEKLNGRDCLDKAYIEKALELAAQDKVDPKIKPTRQAFYQALNAGDITRCENILEEWHTLEATPGEEYLGATWLLANRKGEHPLALKAAGRLAELAPGQGLLATVLCLLQLNDLEQILTLLGEEAEIKGPLEDEDLAAAYFIRSTAFKDKNRYPEAIADLNQALSLDQKNHEAYLESLANCYKQQGDFRHWLIVLRRQRRLFPQNPDLVMQQGYVLNRLGRTKAATKTYLELASDKFASTALGRIAQLLRTGEKNFTWVQSAPDYAQFAKNKVFHNIFVIVIAATTKRFEPATLEAAIDYFLEIGSFPQTPIFLYALYLLHASRSPKEAEFLARFARSPTIPPAAKAAAILASVRYAHEGEESIDSAQQWLATLESQFSEAAAEQAIGRSLELAKAYTEWKDSGKEQVLLRLPEEERKLLTEAVSPLEGFTALLP